MAITLDGIRSALETLSPDERIKLLDQIHTIIGRESGSGATTDFLSRFPNLRFYNGYVELSKPSDISLLSKIEWDHLILDLRGHEIDGLILKNILARNGTTAMKWGTMTIVYRAPQIEVLNYGSLYGSSLLDLLDMDTVTKVKGEFPTDFWIHLPPNIRQVETQNVEDIRSPHPIVLKSGSPYYAELNSCVEGLDAPLEWDVVTQMLNENPQITKVGIRADTLQEVPHWPFPRVLGVWIWARDVEEEAYARSLCQRWGVEILNE